MDTPVKARGKETSRKKVIPMVLRKNTKTIRIWTPIYKAYKDGASMANIAISDLVSMTLFEAIREKEPVIHALAKTYNIDENEARQIVDKIFEKILASRHPLIKLIET